MVVVVAVVCEKEADQICMVLVGAAFESLNLLEERLPVPRLEFFPLALGSGISSSFSPKCFDGDQNSIRPLSIRQKLDSRETLAHGHGLARDEESTDSHWMGRRSERGGPELARRRRSHLALRRHPSR